MSSSLQSEAGSEAKRALMDLNQSMEFDLAADDPSAQHHRQDLELFWNQQLSEISNARMISAETPLPFSKACELFILELTLRAWLQTTDYKRRALQRCDISRAIRQENMLDFLNRVVPYDHEQVLSFSLAHAWKMDLS
ncbi:hypothetical protein POTOM_017268 [Populus tomentosa]|uniref:Core Histone H2A/H2B/H3 domain-containing protein n=1 Tax=Populus tomentosa TaxID=118781 RepID=A0A8X7ZYL0_POPTO|nr:hypothetical protein POTOM_017268 [Populus tomentosa]